MSATALRPLQNPKAGADVEVLLEPIARCRRRARFVLFVRYAAVACAIGVAVAAAAPFVSQPLSWGLAAIAVCAGISGAVAAVWRCPSLFQTAAEIDRRYHLDDSVVAALQMRDSGAPVAPLVVRNAITRARDVDAAIVFPLEARRHAAAVAIAASLLLVTTLPGGSPTAGTRLAGRGMAGAAVAGSPTADSPREPTSDEAPSTLRAAADALSAGTPREGASESARERPEDSGSSPAASTASLGAEASAKAATNRTPSDPASSPRDPRRSSSALPVEGQPGGTRPSASADGIVRDAASGPGAAGRGGSGAGGSGASGVGRGSGAGGVRGGALINAGADADAGPLPPAQSGGRSVQGGRAAAAVTHDDVPPDLRAYVRDYFAAIAPAAGRR